VMYTYNPHTEPMPEEVVNEENNISTKPCEEAEEEHEVDNKEVPLYPGATISLKVVLLLLLAFVVHHKLSKEAMDDLLYIINLTCPQPNNCCTSLDCSLTCRFLLTLAIIVPLALCPLTTL